MYKRGHAGSSSAQPTLTTTTP
ncbi:hypothetical protein E2C01_050267 [Portunus trituberculatus]|uniref:Uncharacterized protein n=1 Tax=Portunus trituberculatus TaxID=210409 RepID=A0A5B7GIG8_PORTR|nr:hypothetical protein [Portunus trituberculatus]